MMQQLRDSFLVEDYIGVGCGCGSFGEFVQQTQDWIVAKTNEKPKECSVGKLNTGQIVSLQQSLS